MSQPEPPIRNISDTARWAALYRARESERPDAVFRDPFARRLAGDRGEQIAQAVAFTEEHAWTWTTRTYLFDQFIAEQIAQGVDTVLNLAAGLDARPYRMALPPSLKWIEIDLPDLMDYKEQILAGEKPVCALERIRLDLSNGDGRRELFARVGREAAKALIVTEGLLIYLTADDVGALARDLANVPNFQRWVCDLTSPKLLSMMQERMGAQLDRAKAPFHFAPEEGPGFFARHGWKPSDVRSMLKTARKLKRLSFKMRLISMLPESPPPPGNRPWAGICLLEKQ
jgi:methyltransferase (TIGR00027 family)